MQTLAWRVFWVGWLAACHDASHPNPGAPSDQLTPQPVQARCRDRFCFIPAGEFLMGSPADEPYRSVHTEPLHKVTLTHNFLLGQFEITRREWQQLGFEDQTGSTSYPSGQDCTEAECPVTHLSWFDAVEFANERSRREGLPECIALTGCTGERGAGLLCDGFEQTTPSYYDCRGYRLPTSAEFEYATRAGTTTAFFSGPLDPPTNDCSLLPHLAEVAWYCANSDYKTHPVGQKKPNPWGLHDIIGNAFEWGASLPFGTTIGFDPVIDPGANLGTKPDRQIYGGCAWVSEGILRSASQASVALALEMGVTRGPGGGLRLARTLSPEQAKTW